MKLIRNNGITLIVLVITVIILLILAGVAIATLTGENGILTKAETAKERHIIEQYKEEISLIIAEEVAERKIDKKDELMIVSLDKKIRQKEWVNEIYKCNSSGEEQPTFEASTHLLVESKEHYEFLIEVNEEKETAKIVSSIKGTGEKYQITYNPNGGTGVEEIIEIRQGFSTTLKECVYTKEQYKFVGWSEKQNGEGERFLSGSSYKPTKKVTLYAIWEINVATITFNSNDGTGVKKQVEVTKGKETKLPENIFTRKGYKLIEWNTKQDGTGTKYGNGANINIGEDITLYAIWQEPTTIKEAKEAGTILSTTQNKILTDDIGSSIVLPAGFKVSSESADSVIDGVVIEDVSYGATAGSEFVWIPVADETPYERNRSYEVVNLSTTAYDGTGYLPDGITNEEQAVRSAGGFYISRYEAGKEGESTLVNKRGANVWINIAQETAKITAKTMYTNMNVKSALASGIQWDMTMAFIASKPRVDGKGNEYDVTKAVTSGNSNRHVGNSVVVTGNNEADKVCNIYDLEGNAYEYVAEKHSQNNDYPFILRGGRYDSGSASMRNTYSGNAVSDSSFRIVLYVK